MDIYEMLLDAENGYTGVYTMSLVKTPAIKSRFVKLAAEPDALVKAKSLNEKRRLIIGAALIPDLPILRVDEDTKETYAIFFSAETVEQTAHAFLKNGHQTSANLDHDGKPLEGISVVETWLKTTESDKSADAGLDLPMGSWVIIQEIENEEVYNDSILTGEVQGFSLEGLFKPVQQIDLLSEIDRACKTRMG